MNVMQSEYLSQGSEIAGIRLLVHPNKRMPFPEDEGITVKPGVSTSIGIRQVRVEIHEAY